MGGTGSVQKPSSAPGVPVAIATELNFHEQSESKSEQAAPVIRFIDFNNFAKLGSFPRYPDNADIVTALDDIDRSNAFMVFISHCWLRGWSGAEGWDGRPHPDNASHDKYQLTVDGIRKVWKVIAPNMEKCFIWLDFGCINQDGDPGGELSQLDRIVGCTDCLFTPIHDPEDIESLTPGVSNVYENYKSKWWRGEN